MINRDILNVADKKDMCANAKSVEIGLLEEFIVNAFTILDGILHLGDFPTETPMQRIELMWRGKIEDYKRFVALAEKYDGKLPSNVKRLLTYSPCGIAKMTALYLR